jgi:hypothetical protein
MALTLLFILVHHTFAAALNATAERNCTTVKPPDEYYADQLDLLYTYSVEFDAKSKTIRLTGLELALSSAVSGLLADKCDSMDRPMYKVKSDAKHYFAHDGKSFS